jgi:hypothetical protein
VLQEDEDGRALLGKLCGEKVIIGHISFDIYHLSFADLWLLKVHGLLVAEGLEMVNDKCQMIYDQ